MDFRNINKLFKRKQSADLGPLSENKFVRKFEEAAKMWDSQPDVEQDEEQGEEQVVTVEYSARNDFIPSKWKRQATILSPLGRKLFYNRRRRFNYTKQAIFNSLINSQFKCRHCHQMKVALVGYYRFRLNRFVSSSFVCTYCEDNFQRQARYEDHCYVNISYESKPDDKAYDKADEKPPMAKRSRFQEIFQKYSCIR